MNTEFNRNWTTDNNGFALMDNEVERYISVVPSENQMRLAEKPFYCFIHFGMNTATAREWGKGNETVDNFTISAVDAEQWASVIKKAALRELFLPASIMTGFVCGIQNIRISA